MPRFRIEFTKDDQVRFLSHLDTMKAFERAIRRAEVPIAFSEGFNPHPKMNFASALAVGVTSDAEYLDIDLKHQVDAEDLVGSMARAMPPGIQIKAVRQVPDNAPALMAEVDRAVYHVVCPFKEKEFISGEQINNGIREFLDQGEIMIIKKTKKGPKPKDIRPGILGLQAAVQENEVKFTIMTKTGTEGNVRPEEVIGAFVKHSGLPLDDDSLYIRRVGLYVEHSGKLTSPLDMH